VITVDVDQPFQFLGKSVLRNLGGLLKEFGKKDGKTAERYRTVRKGEKDPWDVFDYIFEKIDRSGCEAKFFIPVGDRSEYDVQPSWHNEDYRSLIGRISGKYGTGLHPSYYSSGNSPKLKAEAERLRKITSAEITFARFHYLNIKFPSSYSNLIEAGISEDFSMGYHDEPGFRAGIARPFNFYNLIEEKITSLKLYPFQVMDGTLFKYKKLKPDEADNLVAGLIDETRKAGGLFISIWHNTSLLDTPEWMDWRRVFENMLIRQQ